MSSALNHDIVDAITCVETPLAKVQSCRVPLSAGDRARRKDKSSAARQGAATLMSSDSALETLRARALVCAVFLCAAALAGVYYLGVFSPAVIVLPLGLYFLSAAQSFGRALLVYIACALSDLSLRGAVLFGWLADRGLLRSDASRHEHVLVLAVVQATLLATFAVAQIMRRAAARSLEAHEQVAEAALRREARLIEAKEELERVLVRSGMGHFSDRSVGHFRLGRVLGRGAMGEVYEAVHVETGELAAVKVLQPQSLTDPELLRRFVREAEIAARLRVPNVVRVFEIGAAYAPLPYIAMEKLTGEDLSDHLKRRGRLPPADVLRLIREVGAGLAAAHALGIVHRDIKPRNVFLANVEEGAIWKVLDFGVSKLDEGSAPFTIDRIVGTPGYMPPEQAAGHEVTPHADIYALGVMAYRALTGHPISASVPASKSDAPANEPLDPCVRSPDVDLVFALALAEKPEDRFASGALFADALELAFENRLPAELRARAELLRD